MDKPIDAPGNFQATRNTTYDDPKKWNLRKDFTLNTSYLTQTTRQSELYIVEWMNKLGVIYKKHYWRKFRNEQSKITFFILQNTIVWAYEQ